ncbi:uncharacterized protein LOC135466186 isoform X2 [Liolophura sinensis]|uniref:uncharacterized protein LOC135466186 isoform X2 n=1 Tax=Liolophura sinensis TaxID=3198878 RepID=UPI0031593DA0
MNFSMRRESLGQHWPMHTPTAGMDLARPQAVAAAAQAQAEAQVQASSTTDGFQLNCSSYETDVTAGGFLTPNTPSQHIGTSQGNLSNAQQQQQQQNSLSSDTLHFISQPLHNQSSTPSPGNGSPLVQAQPQVINPLASNHMQYLQGRRSASPATGQHYASSSSPLVSRALTPSQSPITIQTNVGSPMFPHSIAPNQTVINNVKVSRSVTPGHTSSVTPSSGVNINTFQLQTSMQPPMQVANAMQVQGILQTPTSAAQTQFTTSGGQQFIQQKTVVPNIVQTQPQQILHSQPAQTVIQNLQNQNLLQAIQQNPGLLQNMNFSTAVSSAQQVKSSASGVNVFSAVPGSVQNTVGLQGTIIQTAQGKSILIPNQLQGQQIAVAGLQNLQPIAVRPPVNLTQQPSGSGITTIQGTTSNPVSQPQISVLNINPQGQQIVIQRAPGPGQPQNIILRTLQPNFIQLQTAAGQPSQISTSQSPILSQISQTPQSQGSIPLQPLLSSSQGQQINLLNQAGQLQVGPQGTVTLNIGNQNVNLPQVPSAGSFQPTQLQAHSQRSLSNQPTLQPSATSLPVISQYSIQPSQSAPQTSNVPSQQKPSKKPNKKAQAAANKAQQLAAATAGSQPGVQIIQAAGQGVLGRQTVLQPQQTQSQHVINNTGHKDNVLVGKAQSLTNIIQTVPNPGLTQFSNSAGVNVSSLSYSTANTTPVTTTVSHSSGQTMSHVSLANSDYSAPLTSSSVLTSPQVTVVNGATGADQALLTNQVNFVSQTLQAGPLTQSGQQAQVVVGGQQQQSAVQLQSIQLSSQDQLALHRIQQEIKTLLERKQHTPEEKFKMQQLRVLHGRILNKGRQQHLNSQQSVNAGQITIGQPQPPTQQSVTDQQPSHGQTTNLQVGLGHKMIIPQVPNSAGTQTVQVAPRPAQSVISVAGNIPHVIGPNQTVVKLDTVKPGTVIPGQVVGSKTVLANQVLVPAVPANAPPGKLPISASPAVPTQVKIGSHVVTLNLTPQLKEKLLSQLAKMTPEQQQQFYRYQYNVIQRLQQQHQIQQQIQAAQLRKQQIKPADSKIPTTVQLVEKPGLAKLSDNLQSPSRGVKRPAATEIPKGSMIHQQLSKDQDKAVKPDAKIPFKSVKDACQRLLRYHVFQSHGPSKREFKKVDGLFDQVSQELLRKRDQMFAKYQLLLLEESMREKSTAEMVMIERVLNQDLTDVIEEEKKQVEQDPDSFEAMPAKYLKPAVEEVKDDGSEEEGSAASPTVKMEVTGSETPVDVEHGSSPENPLDSAKSPVRSVMSNGGFKLVIRKNHFCSPRAEELTEKKALDSSAEKKYELPPDQVVAPTVDLVPKAETEIQSTVLKSEKVSPSHIMVPQIKTEPEFEFNPVDSIQEVPETPFKAFSGENHPHDMFFGDSDACSPEADNGGFSLHTNTFPKSEPAAVIKEESFPLVCNSGIEDISGDNETLPDLEEQSSLPTNETVNSAGSARSRCNSETDAALEGLLNCSNADNMDGYQFDPDDFKPMGNQSEVSADQFDISDPFDENGDFFGYGSEYCNQTNNMNMSTTNHLPTVSDASHPIQHSKMNGTDGEGQGNGQPFSLVGQYEAISPVSDRSGGFNDELVMTGGGQGRTVAGQMMGNPHSPEGFASFFESAQADHSNGVLPPRVSSSRTGSLSVFTDSGGVSNIGGSTEIESAVDSIMDFGGGDQLYSPMIANNHGRVQNSQPSPQTLSRATERPQDLKSHPDKAAHYNLVSNSPIDFDINGGGDSLEHQGEFMFSKEQHDSGGTGHGSNPVFKEQMESAINSILSPSVSDNQDSPFPMDRYTYSQFNNYASPHEAVQQSHSTETSGEVSSQGQHGVEDDLDAAINSILI